MLRKLFKNFGSCTMYTIPRFQIDLLYVLTGCVKKSPTLLNFVNKHFLPLCYWTIAKKAFFFQTLKNTILGLRRDLSGSQARLSDMTGELSESQKLELERNRFVKRVIKQRVINKPKLTLSILGVSAKNRIWNSTHSGKSFSNFQP